jgi:hypothetical protein
MLLSKCSIAIASWLLLTAGAARASDVEAKERAAKTACLAGEFAKGSALLSELYVKTNDAAFIYNQGRCFEQNHRYEDAISRFQEYLRVGKRVSKVDKIDAQKHISDCRAQLALSASSSTSEAAGKEAKERAARKACLTGEPVAGVGILADLFIDTHDTTYLFNQGRCFEQNRRYEDAIGRFREYLMKAKDLGQDEKADTEKHIAACESYLREKPSEEKKAEASTKNIEITPRATPPQPEVAVVEPKARRESDGASFRAAGIVVAVLGGAGLGAGVALNLKVNSMATDLESGYDPSVDSSRKNYKTAMWVGYGAGAACLIGGGVLYYLGWRHSQDLPSVALVPTVTSEMVGTAVWGAF